METKKGLKVYDIFPSLNADCCHGSCFLNEFNRQPLDDHKYDKFFDRFNFQFN